MAGFANVSRYARSFNEGRVTTSTFRKVPSQTTISNMWVDLSMAAGNPPPNYYASSPLVAEYLAPYRGIFHGDNKTPATKHLAHFSITSPTAGFVGRVYLMDFLLYYPFIDCDTVDEQTMDNANALTRYEDGAGVMVVAVAVAPTTGGGSFAFNYINQDGASKTSPTISCNSSSSAITTVMTSQLNTSAGGLPFLRLADGDTGVRSITSVTFDTPAGGLAAFVLVKPLFVSAIREINTTHETDFICRHPAPPRIEDGAHLNMFANPNASVSAGTLTGTANFVWSE